MENGEVYFLEGDKKYLVQHALAKPLIYANDVSPVIFDLESKRAFELRPNWGLREQMDYSRILQRTPKAIIDEYVDTIWTPEYTCSAYTNRMFCWKGEKTVDITLNFAPKTFFSTRNSVSLEKYSVFLTDQKGAVRRLPKLFSELQGNEENIFRLVKAPKNLIAVLERTDDVEVGVIDKAGTVLFSKSTMNWGTTVKPFDADSVIKKIVPDIVWPLPK